MAAWKSKSKGNQRVRDDVCGPYHISVLGRNEWWKLRAQWRGADVLDKCMRMWSHEEI